MSLLTAIPNLIGHCSFNYNMMSRQTKNSTLAKTAAVAVAAGLVTSAASVALAPVAFVGMGAFTYAYLTSSFTAKQALQEAKRAANDRDGLGGYRYAARTINY